MSLTLFVPSIGLDVSLLDRLADSIDCPLLHRVAWNNGPEGALDDFAERRPDWIIKDSPVGNRGCGGSWNECAKWFSSEPAWILANEDCYFLPGYLERICNTALANLHAPAIFLNDSDAFYCWVWTQVGRERFGDFDENLWPAYYEDCDMRIRHRLSGVTEYPYALQGLPPLPHGKPRSGGTNYSAMIQGCGLLNRAYWRRKWGSDSHEGAGYSTPYKDQRLAVKDWVWYPEHRAELFPLWRAFIQQPNPSIYE